MKVSIITVSYNSEKTIAHTIESVLAQTYDDIEYWIIDGKSSDGTVTLAESYCSAMEQKGIIYHILSEPDGGIYDAMNKGIRLATGDVIGIINSDDWYEPDTVEQVVRAYQGNEYEVIYGMQRTYLNGKEKATFIYHHDFLPQQMITHPTCFVTRAVYEHFGVFDLQYKSASDYDLMLRLYRTGKVTFTPVMRVLSNFRLGGMSSSQTGVQENLKVRYKYGYLSKKTLLFQTIKSKVYQWLHERKR